MAKMTHDELVTELSDRGFSSFGATDLSRYVNWGYFRVALSTRAHWEEASYDFNVAAGAFSLDLAASVPTFRTARYVVRTTLNEEMQLEPITDDEFFRIWAPVDLTAAANRGSPSYYFIRGSTLYILPPPDKTHNFELGYWAQVAEITGAGAPVTPIEYDEAIVLASMIPCYQRTQEWSRARECRAELQEFYGIILTDEAMRTWEGPDQVIPDLEVELG